MRQRRVPLFVVCLLAGFAALAAGTDSTEVTKVLVSDGTCRAITNTGTIRAVNRLAGLANIPRDAQLHAVTEILVGASQDGFLVPVQLVAGDRFFAQSPEGELVVIQYDGDSFGLPGGGTSFTTLSIPPG